MTNSDVNRYGLVADVPFGPGGDTEVTPSNSGSNLAIFANDGLYLDDTYASGDPLAGSSTFSSTDFATLGINVAGGPYVWVLAGSGDTITLNFVDISGSSLAASLPGFGIQSTQPFLNTTTTHLRHQAIGGPGTGGGVAHVTPPPASAEAAQGRINDGEEFALLLPAGEMQSGGYDMDLWVQGYGEGGDIDSQGGALGYDYSTGGAALGLDKWLNDNVMVGLFGGWATSDADLSGARVDADSWRAGIQGLKRWERAYLLGSLHYGQSDYDGDRSTFTGTANSDFDGEEYGAYIEMGFPRVIHTSKGVLDGATIQPLVAFQYINLEQDGYTESGAGVSNLVVGDQDTDSQRLSAGLVLSKDVATRFGNLRPFVEGRYTHEFNDDSGVVGVNFAGGGPGFTAMGATPGEDFFEARVGATLDLNERTALYGGYEGRFSEDSTANGGYGGIRIRF